MSLQSIPEKYLPAKIRDYIEHTHYSQVGLKAGFDKIFDDPFFLDDPTKHVAFFSDHSVVHVRDIALQTLKVLDVVNGLLIPKRDTARLEFMRAYGSMITYLHDIGMADFSSFGRAIHPEYAAQAVFQDRFDEFIDLLWRSNCGGMTSRLVNLSNKGLLSNDPRLTLRELLSLSFGHSKSKVPRNILNQPEKLKELAQQNIKTELHKLFYEQKINKLNAKLANADERNNISTLEHELSNCQKELKLLNSAEVENPDVERLYKNFDQESFTWLSGTHPDIQALINDVVDSIRVLRCADALRQRGTTLKTSAGFQIFVDRKTANCVHAISDNASGRMFLLETDDPISSGEANLASTELAVEGDLRVSFVRGDYMSESAVRYAVEAAAYVINDIQADVIASFVRNDADASLKSAAKMMILIEETDDNPSFSYSVTKELEEKYPELKGRCRVMISTKSAAENERNIYHSGTPLSWSEEEKTQLLKKISEKGHLTHDIDVNEALNHVHEVNLSSGSLLMEAGSTPAFVYIPMSYGLKGKPLGGYESFVVEPWVPLGSTGVIRDAPRNATIVAHENVRLIMIPKSIYLKYWHHTYSVTDFRSALKNFYGGEAEGSNTDNSEGGIVDGYH